jgi:hypothetical protein
MSNTARCAVVRNCFVNHTAFQNFLNPWTILSLPPHRGSNPAQLRVDSVSRWTRTEGVETWVRESSVDASTDDRTVILHCIDIAVPLGMNGAATLDWARKVFRDYCRAQFDRCFRAGEQAEWMFDHAQFEYADGDNFVRVYSVEDLS